MAVEDAGNQSAGEVNIREFVTDRGGLPLLSETGFADLMASTHDNAYRAWQNRLFVANDRTPEEVAAHERQADEEEALVEATVGVLDMLFPGHNWVEEFRYPPKSQPEPASQATVMRPKIASEIQTAEELTAYVAGSPSLGPIATKGGLRTPIGLPEGNVSIRRRVERARALLEDSNS
jgi:hypothetical protein